MLKIVDVNDAAAIIKSPIDAEAVVASYFSLRRARRADERRRNPGAECSRREERSRAAGAFRAISKADSLDPIFGDKQKRESFAADIL